MNHSDIKIDSPPDSDRDGDTFEDAEDTVAQTGSKIDRPPSNTSTRSLTNRSPSNASGRSLTARHDSNSSSTEVPSSLSVTSHPKEATIEETTPKGKRETFDGTSNEEEQDKDHNRNSGTSSVENNTEVIDGPVSGSFSDIQLGDKEQHGAEEERGRTDSIASVQSVRSASGSQEPSAPARTPNLSMSSTSGFGMGWGQSKQNPQPPPLSKKLS